MTKIEHQHDDSHPDLPWVVAGDGRVTARFESKQQAVYFASLAHEIGAGTSVLNMSADDLWAARMLKLKVYRLKFLRADDNAAKGIARMEAEELSPLALTVRVMALFGHGWTVDPDQPEENKNILLFC